MAKYDAALEALRRLNQYKEGRTVQPGMFSTLDEAIQEAPFEVRTAKDWADYLQPGRMVKREGAEFPVKKDELVSTGLLDELGLHGGVNDLTKTELLSIVREGRPKFSLDVSKEVYDASGVDARSVEDSAPEAWGEVFRHSEVDPNTGGIPDLDRIKVMEPKFGAKYGGDGRYHHTSPSSTYEESFTKLNGMVAPTHHTGDTLSWSRITTHEMPQKSFEVGYHPSRVRLIEEIQADVHRKAASKLWFNPENRRFYSNEESAKLSTDTPEIIEDAGRVGYRTDDTTLEIAELKRTAENLDAKLKKLDPITPGGNVSKRYANMEAKYEKTVNELDRLELKMPDAPHKKPQEYAQLELRKQLMNAVDDGEDYLALVRGKDQIERYRNIEDLTEKKQANMNRMYDEIYAGELKKLAKRYGATVEDVEIQVNRHLDPEQRTMPEALDNSGYDSMDEAMEGIMRSWDSSPQSAVHDLDIMHESLRDVNWTEGADQKGAGQLAKRVRAFKDKLEMEQRVGNDAWNTMMRADLENLTNEFEVIVDTWRQATGVGVGGDVVTKSFPAIKITPEVRERILRIGVPQFQHGGLVRADAMPGMEYIPTMEHLESATEEELDRLRSINYQLSGGETADEVNRIRELERMYNDPQYWKDVPRHTLSAMKSLWKTLDQETGESTWNFGAAPPPFEMVERGIMTLEEWKEMKEVADRVEKEKPMRPGIIDETIAMRALMTEFANLFRDERVEPPEYALEAMNESMALQKATEEQMGLDPAIGFPQRFSQMLGFMLGQVPSPKSLTEATGMALVKAAPKLTAKVPRALKVGVGAPLEFMDPTIRPALSTYLTGATAGTGLIYGIEAAAEAKLKALEEKLDEEELEQLEDPEEFAKGGAISKALKKLKETEEGVINAEDVFAAKKLEAKRQDPKFQTWINEFHLKIEERSAKKAAQMAELEFSYSPGDVVMGEKYRHEILAKTIDNRDGKPAYHVKNLDDESEYMLPERGITGKFEGPKDVELMQELEAVRYEAVEEFDEIFEMIGDEPHGYDLQKMEITEKVEGKGDKYRGRLKTPDGDLWFTYDLSELNPGKTFVLDEIE